MNDNCVKYCCTDVQCMICVTGVSLIQSGVSVIDSVSYVFCDRLRINIVKLKDAVAVVISILIRPCNNILIFFRKLVQ